MDHNSDLKRIMLVVNGQNDPDFEHNKFLINETKNALDYLQNLTNQMQKDLGQEYFGKIQNTIQETIHVFTKKNLRN